MSLVYLLWLGCFGRRCRGMDWQGALAGDFRWIGFRGRSELEVGSGFGRRERVSGFVVNIYRWRRR